MSKRKQHAPEFKAKVALEALKRRGLEGPSRQWRGVSPNNAAELASRFGVHLEPTGHAKHVR